MASKNDKVGAEGAPADTQVLGSVAPANDTNAKQAAIDNAKAEAEEAARLAEEMKTLVPMFKDGVTQHVHPSCVISHQQVGWKVI